MKKEIWIIILIILIMGAVIVFTKKTKDITIDINKLVEDIMQNIKFEDELNKVDSETVAKLYDINNTVFQEVYMSSGATAICDRLEQKMLKGKIITHSSITAKPFFESTLYNKHDEIIVEVKGLNSKRK